MTQRHVALRLFDFLDEHAFGPVLSASPERFPQELQQMAGDLGVGTSGSL